MKYLRYLLFILVIFFLYKCIDRFVMELIWQFIQQTYPIPSGFIYTIDSYVPKILSVIISISLSGWFFSLLKWEIPFFDFYQERNHPKQQELYKVALAESKLEIKEQSMGKQYVIQLTEDELLHFWSTLEELDKNLEEKVSFDFGTSPNKHLTVHLIGGESKKYKKWGQNFMFLLFIFGTLVGIYLVIAEIWSLIT
ncbi:hypothetical protein [Shimazuella alba]|uniref:Uncharacterized protein n=1 Tax=Shimazuella alba TaxID=2690964 RepID=A0A6I4W043_9BACL|nr:hypothetical protein [Shimazuella alba]MXQ55590.1 hypothetical protein [Shimazuella alba]